MSADSMMQLLGEIDGRPCYWAEPDRFERPGFWFWDGTKNVHVPLPPKPAEPKRFDPDLRYRDEDLVYSAFARCKCGAGLAYLKWIGSRGFWACSAQLKHEVLAGELPVLFPERTFVSDVPELPHNLARWFMVYDVKSEGQPSANGATTRPAPGTIPRAS